jgi:hypothetical protein
LGEGCFNAAMQSGKVAVAAGFRLIDKKETLRVLCSGRSGREPLFSEKLRALLSKDESPDVPIKKGWWFRYA